MVGLEFDTSNKYSCPLLSSFVINGDKLEDAEEGAGKIGYTKPHIASVDVNMEECPHQHHQLHPHTNSRDHIHDDHLLSQLFITQTSVAVMTSPQQVGSMGTLSRSRSRPCLDTHSVKYEPDPGCVECQPLCHKSNTERVVVALLFGALIIIFLTLVLSLVYLRETQQQQQYTHSLVHYNTADRKLTTEERLIQWGAANNVKIKPGTTSQVSREEMQGTCQHPQCWSLGRRMMLMADKSLDPCDSLYDAACGGWIVNLTTVSSTSGQALDNVSVMDHNKLNIDKKIKDIILNLEDQRNDDNELVKLKIFYESCMDISTIRNRGYGPAVEFVQKTFGAYLNPAYDDTDGSDLTDVVVDILRYSGTALFDVGVDVDPSDNNNILGVISLPRTKHTAPFQPRWRQSSLDVQHSVTLRSRSRRRAGVGGNNTVISSSTVYKEIQAAVDAQKIGKLFTLVENYKILNNYSQPFKQSTTDEIVGFVAALTKMIPSRREEQQDIQNNKIYNKYNIAELQSSFRYVNWQILMSRVFGSTVTSSQLFLVHFPSFLRQLDRMVSLFGVRVARLSLIVLFAQEVLEEVVSTSSGSITGERWRYCSGLTKSLYPEATSHLYIKSFTEYERHQMVLKAKEMFKEMRKKSIRQVESTSWLSRQTKSKVMQKLATTKVLVDPPSFYLNTTAIQIGLKSVNISHNSFFINVLNLGQRQRRNMFRLKVHGVNEDVFAWTMTATPLDVNAFRIRQFNSIVLPFGLLVSTLHGYHGVPSYITDGSLGFIIGHEIIHSLDYSGQGFDLQGKLAMVWDQTSLVRYDKKSECLKKSYNSNHKRQILYRGQVVQLEVDGEFTFDENLCDVEALEMISKKELDNMERQDQLPGVSFTKNQTFFINIAQGYCGLIGSVSHVLLSHLSQHSTFRERIDGMMMNSPLFAETFHCRPGSRMNPARKCGHMFGK